MRDNTRTSQNSWAVAEAIEAVKLSRIGADIEEIYEYMGEIVEAPKGDRFRYIRDWINGSSANGGNQWVEIKAIEVLTGINRALGVTPTSNFPINGGIVYATDGDASNSALFTDGTGNTIQYLQIDMGAVYAIDKIQIWHYWTDGRVYNKTKTEVSLDGVHWFCVFDSLYEGTYAESAAGKDHLLSGLTLASQAEMEAGNSTAIKSFSPLRIRQAIDYVTRFGGLGTDGALNISSGTTTLTLVNNQIVREYSSINISGSAILDIVGATGTNGGIAYIKCLGDFTMSGGTLRMNGQGGAGGAGGTFQSTPGQPGGNGFSLLGIPDFYSKGGVPGTTYTLAGIAENSPGYIGFHGTLATKLQKICAGSGGAGGSMSNSAFTQGGAGGRGGGLLIIEIRGNINFTGGTIQANGANGSPGSAASGRGGSGGGGSGGSILIMYNGFIANSGTIQCNGGNGANGITGGSSGYTEASGGSGGSGFLASIGGNGPIGGATASNGTSNDYGTGGTGGTSVGSDAGGAGGGGAAGYYLVTKNTSFA